ncbi:MAG: hypothetical protein HYT79_01730 [Elusimicrobia bacterium]|nr:hypothetical protein [Elusimicrobiota bacterium]
MMFLLGAMVMSKMLGANNEEVWENPLSDETIQTNDQDQHASLVTAESSAVSEEYLHAIETSAPPNIPSPPKAHDEPKQETTEDIPDLTVEYAAPDHSAQATARGRRLAPLLEFKTTEPSKKIYWVLASSLLDKALKNTSTTRTLQGPAIAPKRPPATKIHGPGTRKLPNKRGGGTGIVRGTQSTSWLISGPVSMGIVGPGGGNEPGIVSGEPPGSLPVDVTVRGLQIRIAVWDCGGVDDEDMLKLTLNPDEPTAQQAVITPHFPRGRTVDFDPPDSSLTTAVSFTLKKGRNKLRFTALSEGSSPPNTGCLRYVPPTDLIKGPANQNWKSGLKAGQTHDIIIDSP